MREMVGFRINEDYASRLFADGEGVKLGFVRKVVIAVDDPRFPGIGELQREIRATAGTAFFFGRRYIRKYTPLELAQAKSVRLVVAATFEPAGEQCGTKYDESTACPQCGAGAAQVSCLRLDMRKVPKGKEIATTIADEIIVSQRLAEKMVDAGLTGFELRPVQHKARYEDDAIDLHRLAAGRDILAKAEAAGAAYSSGRFDVWANRAENRALYDRARAEHVALKQEKDQRSRKVMPVWHQLVVASHTAEIVPPTRLGIDPFDEDIKGEYRCPLGDLIGLNLLSEVSISAASRGEADIICSRQFVGTRRGLLRPTRVVLISPKFWRLLTSEGIKGYLVEVAHLV